MALLMLSLPGAAYIYNGQELELPNVDDLPNEVLQDPVYFRTNGEQKGRDGCRVPMPWSGTQSPFGFGPDQSQPWLPMPNYWADYSVESQLSNGASALNFYRRLLALRRQMPVLRQGSVTIEDSGNPNVVKILRENVGAKVLIITNFGDESYFVHDDLAKKTLIASNPTDNPYEVTGNSTVLIEIN
jgi:alpha-glucosidase